MSVRTFLNRAFTPLAGLLLVTGCPDDPVPDDQLTIERLRELEHDVFVAPGAPTELGELPFVAPVADARG